MFLDELDGEEFGNYAPFWEYVNKWKTKEDYLNHYEQQYINTGNK